MTHPREQPSCGDLGENRRIPDGNRVGLAIVSQTIASRIGSRYNAPLREKSGLAAGDGPASGFGTVVSAEIMHKEAKLSVQKRTQAGSAACRRLRRDGLVPGNVYGHHSTPVAVTVASDVLKPIIMGGIRVVDLELDGQVDKALLREVQWDTFGTSIRHFDFMRVDPNERVKIAVPLELKGTAPGALAGGVLEQPLHSITVDCLAYQIPDVIQVRIGNLELGQAIHVRDLDIPENVHCQNAPDAIVVHVIQVQTKDAAPLEGAAGATEPEVIGKKPAAEAGDEKDAGKKK